MYFFIECLFVEVVMLNFCFGFGVGIIDEECWEMSEECCILKKFSGYLKCFRVD